jgi:hypothetical protein
LVFVAGWFSAEFFLAAESILAPKKKPTKVEALMAANAEASVKQYQGIELLLQQLLDKVTGLESWRTSADSSLGSLLQTASDTAMRVQQLEARPPSPPPPPPPPGPHPPPLGFPGIDLNAISTSESRSSASYSEPAPGEPTVSILGLHPL